MIHIQMKQVVFTSRKKKLLPLNTTGNSNFPSKRMCSLDEYSFCPLTFFTTDGYNSTKPAYMPRLYTNAGFLR